MADLCGMTTLLNAIRPDLFGFLMVGALLWIYYYTGEADLEDGWRATLKDENGKFPSAENQLMGEHSPDSINPDDRWA